MLQDNTLYKVLLVITLICFIVFIEVSNKNYRELYEVNRDLLEQIDTTIKDNDKLVQKWSNNYSSLQSDYGDLLVENEKLKEELSGIKLPKYSFSEAEVKLIAVCVQCEAGENNEVAQKYITSVILNRIKSGQFPDSVEEVIYQKVNGVPQFSVAYDGSMDECELSPTVLANVYSVIVSGSKLPDYVMYFYSTSLKEDNWVKSLNVYDTVEGTIFCYEKGDK